MRQKAQSRRRSHKDPGSASGRAKKRCHSESSVRSQAESSQFEVTIPETIASADEDDNNYFDLYNGTFDNDDEVFNTTADASMGRDSAHSTMNLNELSTCLEKIQNNEGAFEEVDYSNLFATVEVANDVDIDKLINSHDYEQNEFVPFEYVKKLMYEDAPTMSAAPDCSFNQSQQFSYGML